MTKGPSSLRHGLPRPGKVKVVGLGRMTKLTPPCYMEKIGWKPCSPRSVTRAHPGSPPQATPLERVLREPPTAGVGDVGTRDPPGELNAL